MCGFRTFAALITNGRNAKTIEPRVNGPMEAVKKLSAQCQDALIFARLRGSWLGKRSFDMSDLYWLTDEQMAKLSPFFPKSHGKPRVDDRRVLSGIIFINRNGLRWRDAPAAYGPHRTLYSR
jgi:hypothetical protein